MARLSSNKPFDALILGAGPAGLGTALALRAAGVGNLAVLDQGGIGDSFRHWPKGTRLLTPSFTSNQYGNLDLNTIHPAVSPAFTLGTEHPTGPQYADYLEAVAAWGRIPVMTRTRVIDVESVAGGFSLLTSSGQRLLTLNLVWAGGEFAFPKRPDFPGASQAIHYANLGDPAALKGKHFVIIGGYESGLDTAFHLLQAGRSVSVLDPAAPWAQKGSDPSLVLSPYTLDRLKWMKSTDRLKLVQGAAKAILTGKQTFRVHVGSRMLTTDARPILASGFGANLGPVSRLFEYKKGVALVGAKDDQSTKTKGLYLAGPALRHYLGKKLLVFCFIYKYRGRFPLVAASIAKRLGAKPKDLKPMLEYYGKHNMVLEDLSCCGDDCEC